MSIKIQVVQETVKFEDIKGGEQFEYNGAKFVKFSKPLYFVANDGCRYGRNAIYLDNGNDAFFVDNTEISKRNKICKLSELEAPFLFWFAGQYCVISGMLSNCRKYCKNLKTGDTFELDGNTVVTVCEVAEEY